MPYTLPKNLCGLYAFAEYPTFYQKTFVAFVPLWDAQHFTKNLYAFVGCPTCYQKTFVAFVPLQNPLHFTKKTLWPLCLCGMPNKIFS
jgi:hypothetical protein